VVDIAPDIGQKRAKDKRTGRRADGEWSVQGLWKTRWPVFDDGKVRCWTVRDEIGRAYHDEEWGRPVHDETRLFEKICLEAFQSGLSWDTILRKRTAFRAAFAGFGIEAVARFGDADVQRLLGDAGIVRNRRKIEATIANARAVVAMHDAGETLAQLVWAHRPAQGPAPGSTADMPATTPESVSLARELKRRGLVFVGPTTVYAMMQAVGVVNDHVADCWVRAEVEALQA
jgi:DNA-3-methyladenine glycosylase I